MTLTADDLAIIDQRVRLAQARTRSAGTIVSRDTTGPKAMVLFDGATVATPAKVTGSTFVAPGYRCLLDRYGTDWVVTNAWAATTFGEANLAMDSLPSATGANTSATFQTINEFGTFTFTKFFDLTFVRAAISVGGFVTGTAGTRANWAIRFTPIEGGIGYSPADLSFGGVVMNQLSTHVPYSSMRRVTNIPAGTYTVNLRWRRLSGSGSLFADTNDSFAVEVDERVRTLTPIL
jgi:hypothetical protein